MSRMPTDGIDALYDQLAGGQAAADPVDALYDQIAGPQAAPSRGLLGRAEDTAASFTAGLAGGIPQAVGQFARLGQATQYAAANPLRTGALAASSAARFAMDPASAIAGTPSMAQQVGQYMNSAADAIPRMPLTASQQLVAQGAGGIADTAGLVGRSALSVAPAAASVPFSPESIAMNVGQTLPMQAASMGAAALGGQPGAFASSMLFESASIVDESYNRLKEANPKMTDQDALERAFLPSVLAAIPAAALDAGTGGEAAVARGVKKQAESAAKSLARRVLASGKEIGRSAIEEALTEPIQGLIEDVGSAVAQPSTAQMQPGDVHAMLVKRGTEALVGGLMGGVGAATVAIPNAAQEPMAPAVAPQQAPQVAAPQPVQAPAQPVDPRVEAVQQSAADRLAGKQAPATPEPGELLRSLGVERQPDQAALEQQQPPAGRQASTLADLLRDETIKPETRKSLADRYAAGEITRDELAAMLEAQIEASPEEKVRREFEAMAAKGSESAPPAAAPVAEAIQQEGQPAAQGVQQGAGPVESVGGQAADAIPPVEVPNGAARPTQEVRRVDGGDGGGQPAPSVRDGGPSVPDVVGEVRPVEQGVRRVVQPDGASAGAQPGDVADGRASAGSVVTGNWFDRVQKTQRDTDRRIKEAPRSGLLSLDTAIPNVPKGKVITSLRDGSTGTIVRVLSDGSVGVRWHDNESAQQNSAGYGGKENYISPELQSEWVVASQAEVQQAFPELAPSSPPETKITTRTIELNQPAAEVPAPRETAGNVVPQRRGAESGALKSQEPTNEVRQEEGQGQGRKELLKPPPEKMPENAPAPAAGESFPAFRGWRWRKTAGNAGAMVPNVPGQKFTQAEIDTLKNWATSRGLTVNVASPTQVRVIGPANQSLSLARYGAQGVKEDASRARRAEAARAQQEQAASREAEANSAESSAWVEETFGKGNINPYNRIQLSQFVEGKSNERRFLTTSRWEDGLRKIGALDAEGNVNWERVREAYQSSRAPVESAPATSSTPAAGALSKPQVSFRSMPPYAVRKTLKDAGFAFDKESRAWIGPDTDEARKVAAEVEAGRKSAVANKPAQEPAKQGDTAAAPEQPAKPTKKYTDTLRAVAQSKREKAEEKLNRDRLTNTARRARMADSVENDARREIAVAKLAEKVADAVDAGEAPELRNIRAIAEIEDLLSIARRAKYDYARSLSEADRERRYPGWQRAGSSDAAQMIPITDALGYLSGAAQPSVHTANYRGFIEKVGTLPKSKQAVAELRRWMGDAESRTYISASNYDTIVKWASKLSTRDASIVMDAAKDFARRRRITNDGEINLDRIIERLEMLRSGVKAPTVDKVTQLERALAGQGGVGIDFFPTPPDLARRLVEMAGVESGMKVLEPSAGNGHIADAIKAAGVTPDVVEVSSTLREILNAKGYEPVAGDFLEYNPGPVYDRIVMNPPFSDRLDVAHVTHAMKLLKPGGRIVAIVGEGPFFGTDKKAQQFRSWLDGLDATSEKLPSGTFMEDQKGLPTTQVASRIVTIDKPAETKQTPPPQVSELRERRALRFNGERWQYRVSPTSGWTSALSKDAAIEAATRSLQDQAVPKFPTAASRLRDGLGPIDASEIESEWNNVVRQVENEREDSVVRRANAAAAALDGLPAKFRDRIAGEFRDQYPHIVEYMTSRKMTPIDVAASLQNNQPSQEPANAPEPQPEQPAPEPTASTPMEGPEGLGSDPTDHGAVTWDSAANALESEREVIAKLKAEEERLNALPDSQGWQTPTAVELRKTREELRTRENGLRALEKAVEAVAKLKEAIGDGQIPNQERAVEIHLAWRRASVGLGIVPSAALRTIRRAERMLLEQVDVGAEPGTTMYVWSDALKGEGKADRVKLAKSFAEKMKKEGEASRREMARIDKRGAMVTPAGKVVARPDPSPTVTDPDKKPTVKAFKTDAERIGGISVATARETSRYAINGVNVSKGGTEVAATDGRRLLVHNRPEGFGVEDGLYLDEDGNDVGKGVLKNKSKEGTFPPYADIIPNYDSSHAVGRFDPVEIASMARRAAVMTSEEARGILFMVGREDSKVVPGMFARSEVGETWIGRGRAEAVFGINPEFLIDAMQWHAKNGSETVDIYSGGPAKPIVIVGADGTVSVIMPITLEAGETIKSATDPNAKVADREFRASQVNDQALEDIRKRMSSKPEAPKSTGKGTKGNPKKRGFSEMADAAAATLDRVAESARERMRQREAQGVRLYSNPFLAPEFYSDMRDIALVAAAEAFKAGIKGGRKLTAIVEKAIATHRPALQERAAEVRQVAAKMLRAANGDPDRFEQVANTVVNQPPRTRAEARAARKAKVEARQAAANAKPPAEAPTVTATTAMKASLKAAEKAANKVQRQAAAVIKSTIVRSYRNGVEAGVARAKAQFMPMVRSLREAAKRNRAMSGIEMRGVADAAAAKQAEVDAIRTTIRKLAQDLPPGIRGKFLTAVEQGTTPLKLARAVRDMHRALSRWEATQFARRIGKWTTKKRLARLDNARRRAVRMMAAVAGTDWATVKAKGTDANAMRAAADRLRDTYEAIRQQYAEHYAENKRIKALREQTAKEAAEEAADNIMRAKKPMPAPEGRKDVRTHPMVRLAQGAMDLLNALQSVEGKFDGSGVLERVVYQPMLRAEDKFFSELRNRTKQIEQAVRRAGFGGLRQAFEALSPMGGKAAERTIDVVLGGKTQTISLGQAISLAAIDSQTEELIDAGMKVQMRDGRFREPIVVTMKEVQAIRQRLASTEPKLLRMVSELKGIMEEMRPGVFRVHRILKGFEPEIVPDRWPRVRNLSAGEKTQALPESSHELVNRVLENSGFLKERTGGTDAPMLVDHVLNVIFDQVEQSSKVMHLAIPVRDAAGVLLDSRVRVAVSDRWGGDLYTKLKQMLMAASRANQVLNTKGARTVHAINSALAIRYLATNVGTYGRQVAGAARLIPYFSAKDWAHGVANAHKVSVEDMANKSGYFWDRYIGNAAGRMSAVMSDEAADRTQPAAIAAQRLALRNLMKRDLHAAYRAQLNVGRAILQTVNFFDGLVARTAWAAAENQARREHPEWSDAKRNRWVADRAAEVIRDTQNGSSPMDLAINAALNRDSGMAAWFLFTSDMYKARNRIARAFKRSAEDGMKMVAAEAASIVIGTALARAAGWGAGRLIASAFGADDKDKRKIDEYYWMPERMAWDVAKQIVPITRPLGPILGQPMVDIMQGAHGGGFTPPALEAINQIYQSVANAANAAKKGDAEKFIKRLGKVVYEVGSTAGLNPFGWLLDKVMREIQKDSPPSGRMGGLKGRL